MIIVVIIACEFGLCEWRVQANPSRACSCAYCRARGNGYYSLQTRSDRPPTPRPPFLFSHRRPRATALPSLPSAATATVCLVLSPPTLPPRRPALSPSGRLSGHCRPRPIVSKILTPGNAAGVLARPTLPRAAATARSSSASFRSLGSIDGGTAERDCPNDDDVADATASTLVPRCSCPRDGVSASSVPRSMMVPLSRSNTPPTKWLPRQLIPQPWRQSVRRFHRSDRSWIDRRMNNRCI